MSQETTQATVQEPTIESQSNLNSGSNEDSNLLQEVMQKKEKLQKAVQERDVFKAELDSLNSKLKKEEELRKVKELESKGEYQKIIDEINVKLEVAESDANAWKEYKQNRKDFLLSQLPEEDRKIYEKLPLTDLETHVSKATSKTATIPGVDNSSPLGSKAGSNNDWTNLGKEAVEKNWTDIVRSYKK